MTTQMDTIIAEQPEVIQPGRLMNVLRARCIARYRMKSIPGRPEELATVAINSTTELPLLISFGYIHGSVRIRKHGGERNREWIDHRDITFKDGWLSEVYDYLDSFFGYADPAIAARRYPTRPIQDNPQA